LDPIAGLALVSALLIALYSTRRALRRAKLRRARSAPRTGTSGKFRISARTELRALDEDFSVLGPTTHPEPRRPGARPTPGSNARRLPPSTRSR
jgi:hypothetical protein